MITGTCHCGSVKWRYEGLPPSATSCNCTLCRRWGALWAYGFMGEEISIAGTTRSYLREPKTIEFHFCPVCACIAYWQTPDAGEDGRYYLAVNLRLADPKDVAQVPIKRFDGFGRFAALPADGRCIADVWF